MVDVSNRNHNKVFYRITRNEYLNNLDNRLNVNYSSLFYGEVKPEAATVFEITDYDELVRKVKAAKDERCRNAYINLYTEKHFGKEYVYDSGKAWVEEGMPHAGRIDRKTFKKYIVTVEIKIIKPTVNDLINHIALEDALDYIEHLDSKKQISLKEYQLKYFLKALRDNDERNY